MMPTFTAHVIGFCIGVFLMGLVLLFVEPSPPPEKHIGTFDVICRNHVVAYSYASSADADRQAFFDKKVCSNWRDVAKFEPKAMLYPLETVNGLTVYYAAFSNGMSIIAVK